MSDIAMTTDTLAGRLRDLANGPVDAHLADLLREIADDISALPGTAGMKLHGTGYEEAEQENRE